ncbi:MAG: YbbR-like domain-containing protein [Christensenellales bacterium]|jgi:YbbR domain-containing protein
MKIKDALLLVGNKLLVLLTKNLRLKALSLVIGVVLWFYVLYSNPNLTRSMTLTDLNAIVTGQTVLSNRGLALVTEQSALSGIRATVSVPYSSYAYLDQDDITIELDLSAVRKAGVSEVRLKGFTGIGTVDSIYPETVEIEVENQDQRTVPVNVALIGHQLGGYWYSAAKTNPSQLSVTGPTSLVQKVASAQVAIDVTDMTEPFSRATQVALLDAQGKAIDSPSLSKTTSSVTVGIDVYPTKRLPIANGIEKTVRGQLANGFVITGVEISPDTITVAGDASLLDSLDEIQIESVPVANAASSFTTLAYVVKLMDLKYVSSEQVNVTVTIEETQLTKTFTGLLPAIENVREGLKAEWISGQCAMRVAGRYTEVSSLDRDDLLLTASAKNLGAGRHKVDISWTIDNHPEIQCEPSPAFGWIEVSKEDG